MTVLLLWVVFANGQAATYTGQHASLAACEAALPAAKAHAERIAAGNPGVIRSFGLACAPLTALPSGPGV